MTGHGTKQVQENSKYRVQLDFSGKALREVDQLRELLNESARSEVIRSALRWLYWCVFEVARGGTIIVERNGKQREIVFPFSVQVNAPSQQEPVKAGYAPSQQEATVKAD